MSDLIDKLSARFPTEAHKSREQGGRKLMYVDIASTIGRLNEVLGGSYDTQILEVRFQGDFVMVHARLSYTDEKGQHRCKDGLGADKLMANDPDKSIKTAYAEAIKKAAHQLGVALYLWDKEEVKAIEQEQRNPKPTGPTQSPPPSVLAPVKDSGPEPITAKQLQQIGIECTRVFGSGIVATNRAKALISEKVGRPIASRKELTTDEAAAVLRGLKATPDGKYAS